MKKLLYMFMLLTILSLSCSKDSVKPSADSVSASEAMHSLDVIKQAYEAKNEITLYNHVNSGLANSIVKYFYFEKAELGFSPRLVRLTDSAIKVNLTWQGTWTFENEKEITMSGVGSLVFNKETMKLSHIEGDNPFLTPAMRN